MDIRVTPDGRLAWQGRGQVRRCRCALGREGIGSSKAEGDGRTPVGRFPLRRVFYRPDRGTVPATVLPVRPLRPVDGWCDDPAHADYNRPVVLPFEAGHERMWRDDGLYDLVVELGYNDDPPVPGRGSAIFLHVAATDFAPTEGCVALARADLVDLLAACDAESYLVVTLETA